MADLNGLKLETADTTKESLHATAPVPDPTVETEAAVVEEPAERFALTDDVAESARERPTDLANALEDKPPTRRSRRARFWTHADVDRAVASARARPSPPRA